MSPSLSRLAASTLGVAAASGVAAFAWGALVERNRFSVRQESVPALDEGGRPLTILHLSDLHMAPWQRGKQEWLRSLRNVEPDLIVNTGDNLGHPDGIDGVIDALATFDGIPGVYVNGSNDYFGPQFKNPFTYFAAPSSEPKQAPSLDTRRLESFFEDRLGWLSLNNAARAIDIRGTRIEFFGTNDAHRGWDHLDTLPGSIAEMREALGKLDEPAGRPALSIGVTHAPYRRVLDTFVDQGAQLIFAGHTHGGQVRIPGQPALVTNCDIPREQAQGLSLWEHDGNSAYLNVSAGIGTSIYAPVRFACPPEAVVMTVTP